MAKQLEIGLQLPQGKTCGDCPFLSQCMTAGITTPSSTECRRFEQAESLASSKAYAVKLVVSVAAFMPVLLMVLHFIAALCNVNFESVKEVEVLLACVGILSLVAAWAFKRS